MKNQFEQELLLSQLETQEYSFNLINAELHDNIGQLLSTTKLLMGMAAMELQQPPDMLKTAEETLSKAILDLRSLSKTMNNGWVHNFNFIGYLKSEQDIINASKRSEIILISSYETLPLETNEQVILFRIVQQILDAIIKIASPCQVNIAIENAGNFIELKIIYNAIVEENELAKKIMQEGNIQKRIKLLNGSIEYAAGESTLLIIKIPVTFND